MSGAIVTTDEIGPDRSTLAITPAKPMSSHCDALVFAPCNRTIVSVDAASAGFPARWTRQRTGRPSNVRLMAWPGPEAPGVLDGAPTHAARTAGPATVAATRNPLRVIVAVDAVTDGPVAVGVARLAVAPTGIELVTTRAAANETSTALTAMVARRATERRRCRVVLGYRAVAGDTHRRSRPRPAPPPPRPPAARSAP